MHEVKKVYQNVLIIPDDLSLGRIKITNNNCFINLNEYDLSWTLECDGKIIQAGAMSSPDIPAGESHEITIPIEKIEPVQGAEYFINIMFSLKTDELWAKRGHIIASEQMKLPVAASGACSMSLDEIPALKMIEEGDDISISGKEFKLNFSKTAGTITSLEYFNTKIFDSEAIISRGFGRREIGGAPQAPQVTYTRIGGPMLNIYRAPVDNDSRSRGRATGSIELWNLKGEVTAFNVKQLNEKSVEVKIDMKSTEPSGYSVTTNTIYTVYGNGRIDVSTTFLPDEASWPLPKLGFIFSCCEGFENIEYFGAGPFENYVDRKTAAFISRYKTRVDEMFVPYVRTQDCGNRTDVRWFTLTNNTGYGIMVVAPMLMNFSALHYTPLDLNKANHPFELERRNETILTVDLAGCGLGNGSCGPPPLDRYLLKTNKAVFSYIIKPYADLLGEKEDIAKY